MELLGEKENQTVSILAKFFAFVQTIFCWQVSHPHTWPTFTYVPICQMFMSQCSRESKPRCRRWKAGISVDEGLMQDKRRYKEKANSRMGETQLQDQGNPTDVSTMGELKNGLKYKLEERGDRVQVEKGGDTWVRVTSGKTLGTLAGLRME